MALDPDAVAWLQTPEGTHAAQEAAHAFAGGSSLLRVIDALRRRHTSEQVRWATTLAEGRVAASAKFDDASRLFFDRETAEQASSDLVARHTATRFAGAGRIGDLGSGAGADALALAAYAPVLAVDLDPGRAALAAANAAVRALPVETLVGDLRDVPLDALDAVWLDPARRDSSGRISDPERWSPPLSEAVRIARGVACAGIKVAPGIDLATVPPDAEVEFISVDGRLVEAVLWFGLIATTRRRATVLPEDVSLAGSPDDGGTPLGEPGRYLYDLDPAVGRANLVDVLAPSLDAWLLAAGVGYLSGDVAHNTPFARRFRIVEWFPFAESRLLEACRSAGAVRVEVMRRASPVETNDLEGRINAGLPGGAGEVLTVALTRIGTEHVAILARRER